jgi:hypothetical protein
MAVAAIVSGQFLLAHVVNTRVMLWHEDSAAQATKYFLYFATLRIYATGAKAKQWIGGTSILTLPARGGG